MPKLQKVGMLSLAILLAQLILTKGLYPLIGRQTQTMFAISPTTGIGGTQIGNTVLGYLSGFIPFDIGNISVLLAMYIGTFAIVFTGFWLYEQRNFKLWQGKNLTQRLFAIILYGHVALYVILLALKFQVPGIAVNLLIGLGVNLLLVSALVTFSAKQFKWPRV